MKFFPGIIGIIGLTQLGCLAKRRDSLMRVQDVSTRDVTSSADTLVEKNAKIHDEYLNIANNSPSTIDIVSADMRNQLLLAAKNHPVARLDRLPKYDPQKLTGFCFGRAMAVHLIGRQMGIKSTSIKKQFIVGDLRSRTAAQTEWRFHVTTLVRGERDIWYAIDPIFPSVMTQTEWIRKTRQIWDEWYQDSPGVDGPQSRLYVVGPDEILPDIRNFVAPNLETGENIIELKFVSAGRQGFSELPLLGKKVFALDNDAAEKFFLTSSESSAADRFNYLSLSFVDGFFIDYNDYFQHLLFGVPAAISDTGSSAISLDVSDTAELPQGISIDFNKVSEFQESHR